MWNVPVRFVVMWAPMLAVSVGGGYYLYEFAQTVLSPGTGFSMDYPTKDGSLKITCKTYSIDLIQQIVVVDQLVIRKKDGSMLARVPHLIATGIAIDQGLAPKVQLKDAELWVKRDPKGDFDILNLFAKQEGTSSQQPWQVSVRDSVIHLTDMTVPGGKRNEINISTGNFVGMGQNLEGGANVEIPGLIKGEFGFKKDGTTPIIFGKKVTGKLQPILARMRAGDERKLMKSITPLSVAGGTVSGDFSIVLQSGGPKYLANVTLDVLTPRWETYLAEKLTFAGTFSEKGLTGKAYVFDKTLKGEIEGSLNYQLGSKKAPEFAGNVKVAGLSSSYLDSIKLKLPKDITFVNSSTDGYLTYGQGGVAWNGKAALANASIYGLKFPQIKGNVSVNGQQLLAVVQPTAIGSTLVEGNFGLNFKSKAIVGSFSTPQLNAKDFSRWLPTNVLESKARLVGIIDGTLAKPNVMVKGSLDPKIKLAGRTLAYNAADVVLRFDGNIFSLDRLALTDKDGSLFASGSLDLKKGLNVRVVGNNIDLAKLADNTSGKLDLQGQVTGSLKDPKYGGKMQGYHVGYAGVPGTIVAIASDISGDSKGVSLKDLVAMKGASQITGLLNLGFADQKLDGMFAVNGLKISDIYEGDIDGFLNFKDVYLGGTLSNPRMSGLFEANKVLAYGFVADSAKGRMTYDGEQFKIVDASAQLSGGTVSGIAGELLAKSKIGKISGKFQKLDLANITQTVFHNAEKSNPDVKSLSSRIAVKGTTSGSFELGIKEGTFASLKSDGRVDDVFVNKATIGSGDWDVLFNGKKWQSNAFIGSLDKYFRIDNGLYAPASGEIGGEFTSYKIPVKELINASEPMFKVSQETDELLNKINGKLGSLVVVSGTVKDPSVNLQDFELSELKLGNEESGISNIGTFSTKATYSANTLTIKDGLLLGPKQSKVNVFGGVINLPDKLAIPDGTAKIAGTIKSENLLDWQKFNLNLTASLFGFPISKFSALAPALKDVDVQVDSANVNLKGTGEKPEIDGHVQLSAGLTPEGKKVTYGLLASRLKYNGDILVGKNKDLNHVETKGAFKFNSIEGKLNASANLNSDYKVDGISPFLISAQLDGDRDVTEFFKQSNGLVLGEKGAHLSGGIEIGNTFEKPTIIGGLVFNLDSLRISTVQSVLERPIDTSLKNLFVSAKVEKDPVLGYVLRTQASSATNYSKLDPNDPELGVVKLDAKFPIFTNATDYIVEPSSILKREIKDGYLAFNSLGLFQSFEKKTYVEGTIFTEKEKPLRISGTIDRPKFSGDIFFDKVKTIIPTLVPGKESAGVALIEPEFDLRFFANNPISIKSSLTSVNAKGAGFVKGTLSDLKADGTLIVESGDLLLPGGNVKLTPDGTINLKYDSSKLTNQAQLNADLHGETSLTALKNGVTPERYEISLDIKGDVLSSDGLTLIATSQPGDLSQDRILQLLGRTDLLTSLLQSGVNTSIETDVKNAAFGFVLPSVFSGLTSEVAKSFHLDYLAVDYNAFEQASVSFAKSLGGGFFVQGRQQLFQPLPGQLTAYDFRIAYRPRRGPNSIKALSFSLGTDQLRPYKLSIDYTSRVRTRKAPYQSLKLYVPNR